MQSDRLSAFTELLQDEIDIGSLLLKVGNGIFGLNESYYFHSEMGFFFEDKLKGVVILQVKFFNVIIVSLHFTKSHAAILPNCQKRGFLCENLIE